MRALEKASQNYASAASSILTMWLSSHSLTVQGRSRDKDHRRQALPNTWPRRLRYSIRTELWDWSQRLARVKIDSRNCLNSTGILWTCAKRGSGPDFGSVGPSLSPRPHLDASHARLRGVWWPDQFLDFYSVLQWREGGTALDLAGFFAKYTRQNWTIQFESIGWPQPQRREGINTVQ